MQVMAIRKIEPGEEITISYCNSVLLKVERRRLMRMYYNFECNCPACLSETNDNDDLSIMDRSIPLGISLDRIETFHVQKKPWLVVHYIFVLYHEFTADPSGKFIPEAEKILSLIFKNKGRSPDLRVDVQSPTVEKDLLLLGRLCCNFSPGRESMAKDLRKKTDFLEKSLKGFTTKHRSLSCTHI